MIISTISNYLNNIDWELTSYFFQVLESFAVVIGLIAIIWQIRSYRRGQTESKIRGYILVMEKLINQDFYNHIERVKVAWKDKSKEAAEFFSGDIVVIISRLKIIQNLIDKKYVDKELLYLSVGSAFVDFEGALRYFESTDKLDWIKNIKTRDKKAFELLDDAKEWFTKNELIFE